MLESQVSFPHAAVPRRWSIGQASYAKVNSSNNSIMAPYIDSDLRVPEVSQTRRGRRRLCVAVSVVLLVLLVASVTVVGTAVGVSRSRKNAGAVGLKKGNATLASSLAPAPAPAPQSYYNALAPIPGTVDNLVLDQLCSSTMYPQLCSEIFHAIPGAQKGDLQQWTVMVMQMSEQAVNESVSLALQMSHLRENHGSVALEQCIEVLMDSLDQINSSMYLVADMELHPSPATESDVQTYMSAAMTDIDTCQQGVSDVGGWSGSAELCGPRADHINQLLSISLTFVNVLGNSEFGSGHNRRLLTVLLPLHSERHREATSNTQAVSRGSTFGGRRGLHSGNSNLGLHNRNELSTYQSPQLQTWTNPMEATAWKL
ncbi:unnamed protein product, partial [Sphagnum troendelagicum]